MHFGTKVFLLIVLAVAVGALVRSGTTRAQSVSTINFSAASYFAREGDGEAIITVTRAGDTSGPVSVDYATSEGTASRRSDFTPAFGTLRFAPGETTKTFSVLITDNFVREDAETADLMLFNPTGGATLLHDAAVLNIADDDSSSSDTNPIDDTRAFVRQHYHDFLNREADEEGLNFWAGQIESCGTDQQCREVRRINVSAAFFLSIEFQSTGYFVRRLYLFYFAGLSPIWREFMRDTQEISRDVIVGQAGWEEKLAANKRTFLEDWYARHRVVLDSQIGFAGKPPVTNEEYVAALFRKIQITPTDAERQALIDGLNTGTETRAGVLGKVADNSELVRREFNGAFVLMEYLGYLRREPDYAGYHFWLDKLNRFNGNFADAEMVKAFLSSIEYRDRFTRSDALPEVFFETEVQSNTPTAVFKLNDAARISQARARAAAGQVQWVTGNVLKESIFYNRAWHFHLDPESIGLADFTIEECQTGFPFVESHLEEVGGSFLAGNFMCSETRIREISPPPR